MRRELFRAHKAKFTAQELPENQVLNQDTVRNTCLSSGLCFGEIVAWQSFGRLGSFGVGDLSANANAQKHLSQDEFFSVFAKLGDGDGSQRHDHDADDSVDAKAKRTLVDLALEQSFVQPLARFLDTNLAKPMPPKFQPAYQPLQSALFARWDPEAPEQLSAAPSSIDRFLVLVEQDPWAKSCDIVLLGCWTKWVVSGLWVGHCVVGLLKLLGQVGVG